MKIKADGKVYDLAEALTLGEYRTMKRRFGMATLADLDFADPDHLAGLLFLALVRENPGLSESELEARVNAISELEPIGAQDPTTADEPSDDSPATKKDAAAEASS